MNLGFLEALRTEVLSSPCRPGMCAGMSPDSSRCDESDCDFGHNQLDRHGVVTIAGDDVLLDGHRRKLRSFRLRKVRTRRVKPP